MKVFFCYSHRDEKLRDRLLTHLSGLRDTYEIKAWYDRRIVAGQEWERQIHEHLDGAELILLLVSPDFLASRYCNDIEVKRAIELHELGRARLIPVILRPCDWQNAPFAKFQALPLDGKPVVGWRTRDEAFLDVVLGVRKGIDDLRTRYLERVKDFTSSRDELSKKVLVLDDERVIADTLAIILRNYGFDVVVGYNGEDGVKLAKQHQPSILVSDVIMTDMNGIDAAVAIREFLPHCNVLLFSGQAATKDLLEAAASKGVKFNFELKPLLPHDLMAKIID